LPLHHIIRRIIVLVSVVAFLLGIYSAGLAKGPVPRFMIMIDEKNLGTYSIDEAEKVITEYLMANGMEVVDAELIKTNMDRDKALQIMNASPRSAAALGLQFGADVVLVGKAISKGSADQIKDTAFRSYQASVSLKAIRTDTAEILAMESREAAKIHVDDLAGGSLAIREAAYPLIRDLLPKMTARLGKAGSGEIRKIQLVIGDVTQIWQVAAVKQVLRERIPGTIEVIQRGFVSGVATFDIHCQGDSQRLAEELTLVNPGPFRLKVLGVAPNKLNMKLVETQ
jgi:hypothetical protein